MRTLTSTETNAVAGGTFKFRWCAPKRPVKCAPRKPEPKPEPKCEPKKKYC